MGRPEKNPVKVDDRFGSLIVARLNFDFVSDSRGYGIKRHLCLCECGRRVAVRASHLKSGNTTSYGCQSSRATMFIRAKKHGHTAGGRFTQEYRAWAKMIARCYDLNDEAYADYGGRGITVDPDWRESFEMFFAHIGPKPSPELSIDRINNNGNYEPGNVRWATMTQQQRNRRSNRLLTYRGEIRCVREWEDLLGFKKGVLGARLYLGWTGDQLFQPQVVRFSRKAAA